MAEVAAGNSAAVWCGTRQQAGFITLEGLVAVPLLTMLLVTMTALFMWSFKTYFTTLADAELVQEVQMAMVRLQGEAAAGTEIKPLNGGRQGFTLRRRTNPLRSEESGKEYLDISYYLHEMTGTSKLVRGDNDAPLTGDHGLARVTITDFSAVADTEYPEVYNLHLTGRSEVTGHEYTVSTAVYIHKPAEQLP